MASKSVPCLLVFSPRWRSLCWGCRPGVSVYACAGTGALLKSRGSSRDRKASRGGPGTAIVMHRVTSQHAAHTIYTKQSAGTFTCTCYACTRTHTPRKTTARCALDCSPVAVFPLLLRKKKRAILGSVISTFTYSTCSMYTVTTHTATQWTWRTQHNNKHTNIRPCGQMVENHRSLSKSQVHA